jgi:hypothetical protein
MTERDALPEEAKALAAKLLPLCRAGVGEGGAAAAMMALAYVAGELIAAASNGDDHLEAGLAIFTGMTADHARAAFERISAEEQLPN